MIQARSPLRITLGGGGTDLPSYYQDYGGFLLSACINQYVYVCATRTFSNGLVLRYSSIERVEQKEDIQHPVIRETLDLIGLDISRLEITTIADIPAGTGLGSSGSFTTALLKALYRLENRSISQKELAEMACHIEIERLQEPVGKQDQYVAAYGGLNSYEFHPDGAVTVTPLKLSGDILTGFKRQVSLFCTGITRSAPTILKVQDDSTRGGDTSMIDNLHYVKELGYRSRDALEAGDISGFGRLLGEHWEFKKRRAPSMTNPDIERYYQAAMEAGALGGKLIGAGGGGFLMFCTEHPVRLRKAMSEQGLAELDYDFDFEGTRLL